MTISDNPVGGWRSGVSGADMAPTPGTLVVTAHATDSSMRCCGCGA